MTNLIIGNVIMLIGSFAEVFAGYAKTKQMTLILQIVKFAFMIAGALVLGSIPCAIITTFMVLRNILECKSWLTNIVKYALIIVATVISIIMNNCGWIGFIPIVAFIVSTVGISTQDVIEYKTVNATTCALFLINDILIQSYTSAIVNLFSISANIYRASKTKKAIA